MPPDASGFARAVEPLSVALDVGFPVPIVDSLNSHMPDFSLALVQRIDPRLRTLDDWQLIAALPHFNHCVLVTNDDFLNESRVLTAAHQAHVTLVTVGKSGHDMIKATGMLLTALPDIRHEIEARSRPLVFKLRPTRAKGKTIGQQMSLRASRHGVSTRAMFGAEQLSDDELAHPFTSTP